MPKLVEHDGAASVSSKCPFCNIQATLLLGQMNTFIFCMDNAERWGKAPRKYVFTINQLIETWCPLCALRWQADLVRQGYFFFFIFFFCCVATLKAPRGELNGCVVVVLTWPSVLDLLRHTVRSWNEPLCQALQARLPGCLSNVTQDESICRGKYQTESEDDPSAGCGQDIFKDNGPACHSLM